MGQRAGQWERAGFTCSLSVWPWWCSSGGSSRAQGQGVRLWALASRGGVRVMAGGSSTAPALAAAGVHTGLGLHPGWEGGFAFRWVAAEGFGGAARRNG